MAMIFCKECGKKHSSEAVSCPHCGYTEFVKKTGNTLGPAYKGKYIWLYLVLCWFLGIFGAHRFYSGKT